MTAGPVRFGAYDIIRLIARGGMAEVFLARSDRISGLSRTCAIKRIREQYSRDMTFVSMFIDEARLTIGLEHDNLVRMYDFGQWNGTYYMAMEYVSGTDLSQLRKALSQKGKPMSQSLAVYIITELLLGLSHAHNKRDHEGTLLGVVHRDVSPQNVLLSRDGEVKLTDFGVAAARNKLSKTQPGTVLGKSAYMAPEQARGDPLDGRADLFAVGIILHELLTGERLFAHEGGDAPTLDNVFHKQVALPSQLNPQIDRRLDAICMRALRRDPTTRYQTADEMRMDLDTVLRDHPAGPRELSIEVEGLEWSDDTVSLRPKIARKSDEAAAELATEVIFAASQADDPEVARLKQLLDRDRNLWTLVSLGERYAALSSRSAALTAFRAAALMFAYRGRLVEAVAAHHPAKQLLSTFELEEDLVGLCDLDEGDDDELERLALRMGVEGTVKSLRAMEDETSAEGAAPAPTTPLFGYLSPREFAKLATMVRVRKVPPNVPIIREGEHGESLYALADGKCTVWCKPDLRAPPEFVTGHEKPPDKVYLGALANGDFFGEFSFLTGRPRSATVETITDARLIEIDQAVIDRVFTLHARYTEPLMRFYKERVVDLMMAKSPIFCRLDPDDRHSMIDEAQLIEMADNTYVVRQGEPPGSLFFIKGGEVEVLREDDGIPIFINKLGAGDFFGEIAAITDQPRTVSVRTMGDATLFRLDRNRLRDILDKRADLREIFEQMIASRTEEAQERVHEHRTLLRET